MFRPLVGQPNRRAIAKAVAMGRAVEDPKDEKVAIVYANRIIPILKWGTRVFGVLGALILVIGLAVNMEAGSAFGGVSMLVCAALTADLLDALPPVRLDQRRA